MRFPRRLRSPIPRPNSVAFCPLGIDYCSQCKHGIGTAQRGAAEVRMLHVATARQMTADGHTARDVAKYLGVSRATLYRHLADEAA